MREETVSIEFVTLVDDVMRRWPATIRVFLDYKMGCIGCPIADFHSVDDACHEHGVDRIEFLHALRVKAGIQRDAAMAQAR